MAKQNLYDIFQKNQYNLKQASKQSKDWFNQQARLLKAQQVTPRSVLKSESVRAENRIVPGCLYMFMYDPKGKDTLPYYDAFPMVFPFKKTPDGFIGLNMHYLPYQPRIQLLQRLMDFASDTKLNENTRLKYSWSLINGVSRFKWAEPCVKQYLLPHVKSTMRKIDAQDWATAMMLPVEQFVGATKTQVWAESLRY